MMRLPVEQLLWRAKYLGAKLQERVEIRSDGSLLPFQHCGL